MSIKNEKVKTKPKKTKPKIAKAEAKPKTLKDPWQPGQSGNPSGRPKLDPELRAIKNLTNKELIEIGNLVIKGNIEELKQVQRDPQATVIKTMIAAVAVKIISKGDMGALDVLLNRLIGKVKDETKISGGFNTALPAQVIVTLPPNGR